MARFVVHRHSAGRRHFDLRLILEGGVRSWSMLKEPPLRKHEKRLAIEREPMSEQDAEQAVIEEDAFGKGRAHVWDAGDVDLIEDATERLLLAFSGKKLEGRYALRRTRWYPGNRWMLEKYGPLRGNLS